MMDRYQYRVEHLFTCELDGAELQNVAGCVERLKLLEGMGRVWGQDMLLEVRGDRLLLSDTETKEELESVALSSIKELRAVLDSDVFSSLLVASMQDHQNTTTSVFLFQCHELRADYIERGLSRALARKPEDLGPSGCPVTAAGPELVKNPSWKPPDEAGSKWSAPDYEVDDPPTPVLATTREETTPPKQEPPPPPESSTAEEEPAAPPRAYTELDRNVDILNHIFSDLEIIMGQLAATDAKDEKRKKKKKKKDKAAEDMPSTEDVATCLHKIKYGFNLLGLLNGEISNPSAPELVHHLFSTLAFLVSHCSKDLPPTIVAPLLTPLCIRLLSDEATTEEDKLWQSLGDPWNIPSTKWPEDDEDIPTFTLEFTDGWRAPEVTETPPSREAATRQAAQRPATRQAAQFPATRQISAQMTPPPPRPDDPIPTYVCVMYDFTARNHLELSITKGEVVELLDVSKQWWKVRNTEGQVGYVPNNVLESAEKAPKEEETPATYVLTKRSKPAEVKAWLEYKGFSNITVRCLGIVGGSVLLEMTREELKAVCPEEGGRVFFQLQAAKSAMAVRDNYALASEGRS
ncbi:epidermal growth factor receptor kinase substrate 8-like protein 3 isoform X2 [Lampris incognitus]|nr:epidermal growth factor receptor kinase substrate 8-like protein 3 isoform X2 [Lampris incognitus]